MPNEKSIRRAFASLLYALWTIGPTPAVALAVPLCPGVHCVCRFVLFGRFLLFGRPHRSHNTVYMFGPAAAAALPTVGWGKMAGGALLQQLTSFPASVDHLHVQLAAAMLASGVAAFVTLLWVKAPYGRWATTPRGPQHAPPRPSTQHAAWHGATARGGDGGTLPTTGARRYSAGGWWGPLVEARLAWIVGPAPGPTAPCSTGTARGGGLCPNLRRGRANPGSSHAPGP